MVLFLVRGSEQTSKERTTLALRRTLKFVDPTAFTMSKEDAVVREEYGMAGGLERPLASGAGILYAYKKTISRWEKVVACRVLTSLGP